MKHNAVSCGMAIYVISVLAGMLFIYEDFYFNILEVKYIYYSTCTVLMLLGTVGYLWLNGRLAAMFRRISPMDIAVLAWGGCIILSTILSSEKRLAFWGSGQNTGRYTGCFLLLLYVSSYFCVTRYYQASEWHLWFFLAASIFMCLLGITDFFEMDLLHFKEDLQESQRYLFTSTIGNINTYTSCVAMAMAVFGVLSASAQDRIRRYGYGLGLIISYLALILGGSDNAYLSLAAFFGLLPFYLFRFRGGVCRYAMFLAIFLTVLKGVSVIQKNMPGQTAPIQGLLEVLTNVPGLTAVVLAMWAVTLAAYLVEYKTSLLLGRYPALVRFWGVLLLLAFAAVGYAVYDVNLAGHGDRYGRIKEYLFFHDEWGTHRGYIWRIAVEEYLTFPFPQKLFGYGPDTFGAITMASRYPEMAERYFEIFDSVHNEYLQYFITIGPFGALSYLAIHAAAVIQVGKNKMDHPLAVAALLAVLCYAAQAAVNINQPISTPVMWTLLSISAAAPGSGEGRPGSGIPRSRWREPSTEWKPKPSR